MNQIQQHAEQFRELAYLLPRRAVMLNQSADALEQQQREIDRITQVNLLYGAFIADLSDNAAESIAEQCRNVLLLGKHMKESSAVHPPNKEVSPPIDYKARYEAVVQALRDGYNDLPPNGTAGDLIGWVESTSPFTLYNCATCYDEGDIAFEDGDEVKGGACPYCQGGEVSRGERD